MMANFLVKALFVLCVVSCVCGDVYMHLPRGSNNRLDESNRQRANANRLFDSQNNNKGGYNVNKMYYYEGSMLQIEWTNQHGCGDDTVNRCQIVIQYMIEDGTIGNGIRDGQTTNRITVEGPDKYDYGRHEPVEWYTECDSRERNKGLFLADQGNNLNGDTAIYTRQNTNGARYGFECTEERDYYPYWHPSPWHDIAILTNDAAKPINAGYDFRNKANFANPTFCDMYRQESQNVADKGYCVGSNIANGLGAMYNNKAACCASANDATACADEKNTLEDVGEDIIWVEYGAWMEADVDCQPAPWSRYNHLGNGKDGFANKYDWKLPIVPVESTAVLRLRYNMSTADFDPWMTFAESNDDLSVIEDNPTLPYGDGNIAFDLNLNINTDQYGRTFQDRSSSFTIKKNTVGAANIINLNVKGQRGNIVQNYPSVEYDFTPNYLEIGVGTHIHRQVSGSLTTPDGAGEGTDGQDKSNFVQLVDLGRNYPMNYVNQTMIAGKPGAKGWDGMPPQAPGTKHFATLDQFDDELDGALPYQDFGLMAYNEAKTIDYMSSRTNNFSNRSQKGRIVVSSNSNKEDNLKKILMITGIAVGGGVVVGGAVGGVAYGLKTGKISAPWGGSPSLTSSAPAGYV